jgi:hypothetical protein
VNHSTLEILNQQLKRLYSIDPQLAVKVESCWTTERADHLLTATLEHLHQNLIHTTYEEYHSVLTLWLLHRNLYGGFCSAPDYISQTDQAFTA